MTSKKTSGTFLLFQRLLEKLYCSVILNILALHVVYDRGLLQELAITSMFQNCTSLDMNLPGGGLCICHLKLLLLTTPNKQIHVYMFITSVYGFACQEIPNPRAWWWDLFLWEERFRHWGSEDGSGEHERTMTSHWRKNKRSLNKVLYFGI